MPDAKLRFIVRTPHEVVFDAPVMSARVLTETGHVGILPRMEPVVLPIEAGLILARTDGSVAFVGSAGGLLASDGTQATLFTPLGVAGTDPAVIQLALNQALTEPGSELAFRAKLGKLEGRILTQLHRRPGEPPILAGERQ